VTDFGDVSQRVCGFLSDQSGVRMKLIKRLLNLPAMSAVLVVRAYQIFLSPLLGRTCRFHPSCSQYFILAVGKYGLLRGGCKGVRRIGRCHPWNPGGYDPP
jgi:putative membrane protein insertion efficiency factor